MPSAAFPAFKVEGSLFVPTARAGSPWGEGLVHGGPPAGLLARAIERFAAGPEMQITRLTVDLFRPVPSRPLEVRTKSLREGRRIHVVEASLYDGGVEVTRAVALLLRRSEGPVPEQAPMVHPVPESLPPSRLGPPPSDHREGFYDNLDVRHFQTDAGGRALWVRLTEPLVEGEEWTPVTRLAATSDFYNALTGGGRSSGFSSINVDMSIYLQRDPEGEWIGMELIRTLDENGIGVVRTPLFDLKGSFGAGLQAVLRNRMERPL